MGVSAVRQHEDFRECGPKRARTLFAESGSGRGEGGCEGAVLDPGNIGTDLAVLLLRMKIWRQQQFMITWQRLGEWYSFRQTVSANSATDARQAAVAEVKEALGDNHQDWVISEIEEAPADVSFGRFGRANAIS